MFTLFQFLKVFPSLLKKLLDKDFGDAIRSGFECTGICPLNPERVLSKLPKEQRNVDSDVQQQLLNKLSSIRYSPGPTTKAPRPKKKDKLPAGASYTCSAEGGMVVLPDDEDDVPVLPPAVQPTGDASSSEECSSDEASGSDEDSSDDKEHSSSSSNEEVSSSEEIGAGIQAIVERLRKKKEEKQKRDQERRKRENKESTEKEKDEHQYLPGSYVVVTYDGDWYLAQVLDKVEEPEAEKGDDYVYLNFMKKHPASDSFQWPSRQDRLNMLREDIIFTCDPPVPSAGTSSSRNPTFTLSKGDLKKAKELQMLKKVYYLTNIYLFFSRTVSFYVPVAVWSHTSTYCTSRYR